MPMGNVAMPCDLIKGYKGQEQGTTMFENHEPNPTHLHCSNPSEEEESPTLPLFGVIFQSLLVILFSDSNRSISSIDHVDHASKIS